LKLYVLTGTIQSPAVREGASW